MQGEFWNLTDMRGCAGVSPVLVAGLYGQPETIGAPDFRSGKDGTVKAMLKISNADNCPGKNKA